MRFVVVALVLALSIPAVASAGLSSNVVNHSAYIEEGAVYESLPNFGVPLSVGSADGVVIDHAATIDTSRSYTQCHAGFGDTYTTLGDVPIRDDYTQLADVSATDQSLVQTVSYGFRYLSVGHGDTINVSMLAWPGDGTATVRDVFTVSVYREIDAQTLQFITELPVPHTYNTIGYDGFIIDESIVSGEDLATLHVVVTMPERYVYAVYPRIRVCDITITGVNTIGAQVDPDPELQQLIDQYAWTNVDSGDVFIADTMAQSAGIGSQSVQVIPTATAAAGVNIYDESYRLNTAWLDSAPVWIPISPNFATPLTNLFELRFARGGTAIPTYQPVGLRMMIYRLATKEIAYSGTWICPSQVPPSWWPIGVAFTSMCRLRISDVIARLSPTTGEQFNWSTFGIGYGCPKTLYEGRSVLCSPSIGYQNNMLGPVTLSNDTRPASWISPFTSGYLWDNRAQPLIQFAKTATVIGVQNKPTNTIQIQPTMVATMTARPITPTGVTAATRTQLARERATQTKIATDLNATAWAGATRIVQTATARAAATRTGVVQATTGAQATATAYKQSLSTQVAAAKTSAAATVTRAVIVNQYDALVKQDPAKNIQDVNTALAGTDAQMGLGSITGAFTALQSGLNSSPCNGLPLPYTMQENTNPAIRITGFNVYIGNGLCQIRTWLENNRDRQPWAFIRTFMSIMLAVGFVWLLVKWMIKER